MNTQPLINMLNKTYVKLPEKKARLTITKDRCPSYSQRTIAGEMVKSGKIL